MIPIKKGEEPKELKEVREFAVREGYSPKAAYGALKNPEKKIVIDALKREQGHLCAYCMSRIPRGDAEHDYSAVSIEHFIPLELPDGKDIGQALDYHNMLAVCHGNTGAQKPGERRSKGKQFLTCDKHKGNVLLRKVDPLDEQTLKSIFYHVDGKIDAEDDDVRYDLLQTLNLNSEHTPLVKERQAALGELIKYLGMYKKEALKEICEIVKSEFEAETDPKTPYVGILIWYLDDTIKGLEMGDDK